LVEQKILKSLAEFVEQFEVQEQMIEVKESISVIPLKQKALDKKEKELEKLHLQKNNLHDLLEQGVYTIDVFLERQNNIVDRIKDVKWDIEKLKQEIYEEQIREKNINEFVRSVKKVFEAYHHTDDIEKKNKLLKSVLEKVTYLRKKEWTKKDQFVIQLYPKI
jgi:site-specific DNA recombinase